MKNIFTLLAILSFSTIWAQSDMIQTKKGDLTIHPVMHATMALEWNEKTIFVDPYGGVEKLSAFGNPDLVIITDIHGDHYNAKTLAALDLSHADLIAPQAVIDKLAGDEIKFRSTYALANGKKTKVQGIKAKAIPMYNLPETEDSRHPKGRGNGYVLNIGGQKVYISGDTEDIVEMRKLKGIDIAFVCMNLPYTMDVDQAADAVLEFQPEIVYPFHYRGGGGKFSDVEKFKQLVDDGDAGIEVRLRDWYGK
jgi:L-ascorbate metabolism protein UlaG (beta-lactamase superfamily)